MLKQTKNSKLFAFIFCQAELGNNYFVKNKIIKIMKQILNVIKK